MRGHKFQVFETSHSVISKKLSPEDVWKVWSDVSSWPQWNHGFLECECESEFIAGKNINLRLKSGQDVTANLTEVVENISFSDLTKAQFGTIEGSHKIDLINGEVKVTHSIKVTVTNEKAEFFREKIWNTVMKPTLPNHVENVVDIAEKRKQLLNSKKRAYESKDKAYPVKKSKTKVDADRNDSSLFNSKLETLIDNSSAPFNVIVRMKILDEDNASSIIQKIIKMGGECKNQDGCRKWEAHKINGKNEIFLIESWETKEHCDRFHNMQKNKAFFHEFLPKFTRREAFLTTELSQKRATSINRLEM